jgi:hypothetical protein
VTTRLKRIGVVVGHGNLSARRLTEILCEEEVAAGTTLIVSGIGTELKTHVGFFRNAIRLYKPRTGVFTIVPRHGQQPCPGGANWLLAVFLSAPANKGDIVYRIPSPQEAAAQALAEAERAKKAEAEAVRKAQDEAERRQQAEEEQQRRVEDIKALRARIELLAVESAGVEQRFAYAEISSAECAARKNRIEQEVEATRKRLAELEGVRADVPVPAPAAIPAVDPAASNDNLKLIKQRFLDGEIDRAEYESLLAINKASAESAAKPVEGSPDDLMREFESLLKSGAISEEKFKELRAKYEARRIP